MRSGSDVTLVAFSKMVGYCLKAAELLEQEGISAEVLNLRSLKPIDRDAIAASVRKTHRIVSVEEGWPQHGVGSGERRRWRVLHWPPLSAGQRAVMGWFQQDMHACHRSAFP